MIAEQVAQANADLSIADELEKVTGRVAHTYASGGPTGLSAAWTTACTEFVLPALEQMAEWMVDAVAIASDLDADTVDADDIADMVDRRLVFLAAYGDLVESAATGATVAEGADPKLAVAGLLGPDRMATLDDRTVRHLRNQAIQLVLATAGPGTIVAVAAEAAERTKKWVTMDDDRVRLAHEELHDVTIGVNEQFDCAGVLCDGPGDPVLPPESLLNCRCICCPGDTESTEEWLSVIFEIERKLAAGEIPPRARGSRPQGGTVRQVVDAIRPPAPIPVVPVPEPVIAPYPTAPPSTVRKPRPMWPWLLPLLLAGEDEDETTAEGEFAMHVRPIAGKWAPASWAMASTFAPDGDEIHHGSAMIAVRPTLDQADMLAIPDGEPASSIHVTLAYLGKIADWSDEIRERVAEVCESFAGQVMEAEVAAVACFEDNDDRPLVAFIDCDGLGALREALVAELDAIAPDLVKRDHGWLPHATLGYTPTPEQEAAAAERVALPLTFAALSFCWGDDEMVYPFPEAPQEMSMTTEHSGTFSTDSATLHGGVRVAVDGTELVGEVELVVIDGRMEGVAGDMEATVDDPVYVVRVWVMNDEGLWEPTEQRVAAHAAGLTPVAEFGEEVDNPDPTEPEDEGGEIEGDEVEMAVRRNALWGALATAPDLTALRVAPRLEHFSPAEFAMSAYRAELDARAATGDWDWEAVMCVEGVPSGDYRQIAPGSLTWRNAPSFAPGAEAATAPRLNRPLSLMLMVQNPETGGHALAYIAGSIWEIERDGANIVGRGFYSRGPWGEMARLLVDEGSITSTSVDLQPDFTYEILVGADGEEMMVVTDATVMGFCYDDDTEILTEERGWQKFCDLDTDDRVATRSPKTGEFEWQGFTYFHHEKWDGEMVTFKSYNVDLRVTPSHRMLVRSQNGVERFVPAADARPTYDGLPLISDWNVEDVERIYISANKRLPTKDVDYDGDDFAAFMGAYLAEGCLRHEPDGSIKGPLFVCQKPESKGYEMYRSLWTRMFGTDGGYNGRYFTICRKALADYLEPLGYAADKYVPNEIKGMSARQLRIFLEFYLAGDGTFSDYKDGTDRGTWKASTVSKRLADDLQEIAQKVGMWAGVVRREVTEDKFVGDRRIAAENCQPYYILSFRNRPGGRPSKAVWEWKKGTEHYDGDVWCVSVPNEALYVRRHGLPIWCGNTLCNFGAIGEAEIWNLGGEDVVAVDDDEAEMLVASGFAVWSLDDGCYAQAEALQLAVTASADLPLAPREHEWDGEGAAQRVAEFCRNEAGDLDGACYGRGFFWRDDDGPAENVGSYRLGFADVIDGRLHAIPRGIFAVAGVLQGAMGGVDLPEADQEAIRSAVSGWYERMAEEFEDESIVPPWAAEMSPDDEGEGIDDTPEVLEAEMMTHA